MHVHTKSGLDSVRHVLCLHSRLYSKGKCPPHSLSLGSNLILYPSGLVVLPSPSKDPALMTEDVENSKTEPAR